MIQLSDATREVSEAGERLDSLQSQFEEASAAKLNLEDDLAKLQQAIANRSTEFESRQQDEQLFDIKEELQTARRVLEDERKQTTTKVAALAFEKTQDIEKARRRIAELESRVAELRIPTTQAQANHLEIDGDDVGHLHVKIQRLRSERDDLLQSTSFAEHENRFALKALEADHQSALEKLQKTEAMLAVEKHELEDKIALLESELSRSMCQRDDLEAKLGAAAQSEINNGAQHQIRDEQLRDMSSQLVILQERCKKAEHELALSAWARSDLEERYRKLQLENGPMTDTRTSEPARTVTRTDNGTKRLSDSTLSAGPSSSEHAAQRVQVEDRPKSPAGQSSVRQSFDVLIKSQKPSRTSRRSSSK